MTFEALYKDLANKFVSEGLYISAVWPHVDFYAQARYADLETVLNILEGLHPELRSLNWI